MDTEMQQAPAIPACPADMDQLSYGQVKNQAIAQAAPRVKQPPDVHRPSCTSNPTSRVSACFGHVSRPRSRGKNRSALFCT